MTKNRGLFFEDWKACLYAHYIHVIRTGDTVTEPTLRHVLLQTGISDDELRALQEEALAFDPEAGPAPVEVVDVPQVAAPEPPPDEEDGADDSYDEEPDEAGPDSWDVPPGQLPLF